MVFGELDAALSLWDRIRSWISPRKDSETIASRFIKLFENHGVHRNQIPRFFGHGLTIANVKDDETLLGVLDDGLLDAAAQMFAVHREWLDGASDQIYPSHVFYKHVEEFIEFIDSITKQNEGANLYGVLLVADSKKHELDTLIIFQETIGWVGNKPIYRYHLCDNWIFKYWKSRGYLTACVASAWIRGVYIIGRKVPIELIQRYAEGSEFLKYEFDSALPTRGEHWHPEDMTVDPEAFLNGIDPERNNFGLIQGLKFWLDLDDRGLMKTGLPVEDVRSKFQEALNKLT